MKKVKAKLFLTSILNIKTMPFIILGMIFVMNLAFASSGISNLSEIFLALACDIKTLLIPIGFLLVVAAAVIYAGGQIGSAEMRGKSQGWAIWALVGAIIAFVISVLGPSLITAMYGNLVGFDINNCPPSCSLTNSGGPSCTRGLPF